MIVFFTEETRFAVVTTLHDVQRHAVEVDAGASGHKRSLAEKSSLAPLIPASSPSFTAIRGQTPRFLALSVPSRKPRATADYQAHKGSAWHHHLTLVAMGLLFILEERIAQKDSYPMLSCSGVETLLKTLLPRRDLGGEEVIRQMEKRHHKRLAATEAKYRKQGLPLSEMIGAVNLTK